MEQKHSNLDIVLILLKKENHVRGIAKDLGTNHPLVSRKVNELLNLNVVDFLQEGKNKTFFLKKSIEAEQFVFMAEHKRLIDLLSSQPSLRRSISSLKDNRKIHLAVLFGSYAKGKAKKDSDIDLYIETNSKELKKEIEKLDSRLSVKIGRLDPKNPLTKEIQKNHVIIKGVERYYARSRILS